MRLKKHCLRIDNDLDGFKQLLRKVRSDKWATLMYDTRTSRLLVLEGDQRAGTGSLIRLACYISADLPRLTLQSIYDRLAEVLEERWEQSWIDG